MNMLERVREIGAEHAQIEERAVAGARQALMREIAGGTLVAKPRHRGRWIGVGGLVAGAAVTAIVVGSVLAPPNASPASAAQILNKAADVAIEGGDWAVPAGRYLKVTEDSEWLVLWDADMPAEWARFNNGAAVDAEAGWVSGARSELYVPSDRSAEWVQVLGAVRRGDSFGARLDEALADDREFNSDANRTEPETVRAPAGVAEAGYSLDQRELWADVPGSPEEFLRQARVEYGAVDAHSTEADSSIIESIGQSTGTVLAPGRTRSTWLRALALLDGSTVESVEGDIATIRFTWSTEWWTAWKVLEIDTKHGYVRSLTDSGAVREAGEQRLPGMPDWQSRTTFDVAVVETAP